MFMSNILASSSFSLGVTGTSRMLCHQLLPSWGIHECELYGVLACPSCQLNDRQEILVESWGVSDRYPSLTLHQSYAAIVYLLLYDTTASRATKCCKLPCYMVQGKICRNPPHVTCSKKHGAGSPVLLEIRSLQACAKRSWPSTTNPGSWPPAARRAVPSTCVRWWPAWASCSESIDHPWRIPGAAIYGNMDTINIPQMLAYIPYMDPMGHDLWCGWVAKIWVP